MYRVVNSFTYSEIVYSRRQSTPGARRDSRQRTADVRVSAVAALRALVVECPTSDVRHPTDRSGIDRRTVNIESLQLSFSSRVFIRL